MRRVNACEAGMRDARQQESAGLACKQTAASDNQLSFFDGYRTLCQPENNQSFLTRFDIRDQEPIASD